nr:nickel insertion protein [Clostridioides sp.]
MSGEIYSYIYDRALSEGALDVYTQSIYMKKNRPAINFL